jgi:hypothetical protein
MVAEHAADSGAGLRATEREASIMATTFPEHFEREYQSHLKHLKLKGLRPKTIEAYARGMRRMGEYFSYQVDALSQNDLAEYFTDLLGAHSWSGVELDLYGWKFFTEHGLRKPWTMPNFIRPPKVSRLPDIVSVSGAPRCAAVGAGAAKDPRRRRRPPRPAATSSTTRRWPRSSAPRCSMPSSAPAWRCPPQQWRRPWLWPNRTLRSTRAPTKGATPLDYRPATAGARLRAAPPCFHSAMHRPCRYCLSCTTFDMSGMTRLAGACPLDGGVMPYGGVTH